ncbi:hypothetical protein B0H10DRAFT_1952762 [Mycena sp. CBHHK59/15]|nr:hypothetical protein B0H10DRAFT_1952762 [Mycena sp. CBHHK59/15]
MHHGVVLDKLHNPSIVDAKRGARYVRELAVSVGVTSNDERVVGQGQDRQHKPLGSGPRGSRRRRWRRSGMRKIKERAAGIDGVIGGRHSEERREIYTKGGRSLSQGKWHKGVAAAAAGDNNRSGKNGPGEMKDAPAYREDMRIMRELRKQGVGNKNTRPQNILEVMMLGEQLACRTEIDAVEISSKAMKRGDDEQGNFVLVKRLRMRQGGHEESGIPGPRSFRSSNGADLVQWGWGCQNTSRMPFTCLRNNTVDGGVRGDQLSGKAVLGTWPFKLRRLGIKHVPDATVVEFRHVVTRQWIACGKRRCQGTMYSPETKGIGIGTQE